jgi:hypothetical protein
MIGSPLLSLSTSIKQRGLNLVASRQCHASDRSGLCRHGNNRLLFQRSPLFVRISRGLRLAFVNAANGTVQGSLKSDRSSQDPVQPALLPALPA